MSDNKNNKYDRQEHQERLNVYAVYPDYWKKSWGELPLLGHVKETSEYWARYAAYDRKLLPFNATFGPKCVLVDSKTKPHSTGFKKKRYDTGNKTG